METQSKARKARKTYDPGAPGEIRHLGGAQFAVQSFRDPDDWYSVDVKAGTCTCPHFLHRVGPALDAGEETDRCKHYQLALVEHLRMVREKVETMTAAQLRETLRRYTYRPEVEGTIREVLQEKLLSLITATSEQIKGRSYCRV